MPQARDLSPFDAGAFEGVIAFDFSAPGWNIPLGTTITSAVVTCDVVSGADNSAADRIIGAAQCDGLKVNQVFGNAVDQVTYRLTCQATFSDGVPREPVWVHCPCAAPN